MSKHTPLPWAAHGTLVLIGKPNTYDRAGRPAWGGFDLRNCPDTDANAQLIVTAVNNHAKLAEALREVKEFMEVELTGTAWADCRHMAHSIGQTLAQLDGELE